MASDCGIAALASCIRSAPLRHLSYNSKNSEGKQVMKEYSYLWIEKHFSKNTLTFKVIQAYLMIFFGEFLT